MVVYVVVFLNVDYFIHSVFLNITYNTVYKIKMYNESLHFMKKKRVFSEKKLYSVHTIVINSAYVCMYVCSLISIIKTTCYAFLIKRKKVFAV